jgi:hypothetical protein
VHGPGPRAGDCRRRGGAAVARLDLLLQLGDALHHARVVPVQALCLGMRHGVIVPQQLAEFIEATGHIVIDGLVAEGRQVLIQIGDTQPARLPQFPAIGQCLATQQLHEARLARAVLAQNADAFALVNGEVDSVEQRPVAIGEREIGESVQQHEGIQRGEGRDGRGL